MRLGLGLSLGGAHCSLYDSTTMAQAFRAWTQANAAADVSGPLAVASQTLLGYWDFGVTSSVTLNSGNVSQVNDLSAGGHNLTQATPGNQFPYTTNGANSYITGAGASGNHQLKNTSFGALTTPNTIFLLANFATPAGVQNFWVDCGTTGVQNCIYRSATATQLIQYAGVNNTINITAGIDAFIQAEFNGASSRMGFNNTFTSHDAGSASSTGGISLGNYYGAGNECTGRIYAVAIFGGILSAGDKTLMKNWGNARLGLSM